MKRLRVGIIGAGTNTRARHIPGLRAIAGVELAAVSNRSLATAKAAAAEFGIDRTEEDWRRVVEDPKIDAIVIGTWPNLHAEVTLAALAAGKHVLTEARMAASLAEAERMLASSRSHPDLVAQVVPAPLSLDFDGIITGMLEEEALGRLREVCITQTAATYADEAKPMTPRQDERQSGINCLSLGIYYETVRRWLGVDPQAVAADGSVFTPERSDGAGGKAAVRVPESLTVLARYREGYRLMAHFSGVERGLPRNEIRLNGSTASLRLDLNGSRLCRTNRHGGAFSG
jgi:predicted dehydrogenase